MGFGAGFSYFGIKEDNIGLTIGCNVFTLVGIAFCFCLKCSSMTFDMNMGIIFIRIYKIFYCKKYIYIKLMKLKKLFLWKVLIIMD